MWPTEPSDWRSLYVSGDLYDDPDDVNPATVDLRGDSLNYSVGYWHFAAAGATDTPPEQVLMFRLRLDKEPKKKTNVWQVLLDTDDDTHIDWALQLNEQTGDRVELVSATTGGPTFQDIELSATASWFGDAATYSLWTQPTGDGSSFDGNADAFLDLAILWDEFALHTGMTSETSFRVAFSTSASRNVINKDLPRALSGTDSVDDGFSDPIAVPESGTLALMALSLAIMVAMKRRQRGQGLATPRQP